MTFILSVIKLAYLKETKNKTKAEIQKSLLAETLVKLNELRQLTSKGKIEATKELIQDVLNSGEKVIVFSSFNAPLNMFKKHFKKEAVMIIGSTSDIERKNAIDEFQSNSKIKVFLGGTIEDNVYSIDNIVYPKM